jgi:polysaccharide chain length determinant protein (PEP-CTERM system associated)
MSSTRVYVDTDSMLRPLMRGMTIDSNLLSEVEIMQKTLLSRPNLQKVARGSGLDRGAEPSEEMLKRLEQNIKVTSQSRNLFLLSMEDRSPKTAKDVVESLLSVFVESNLGSARKDLQTAIRFVDDQIREHEKQLDDIERNIVAFKEKNLGYLPGDSNYFSKLDQSRAEVARTQAEIDERIRKREELQRQLTDVPQFLEVASDDGLGFGAGPPIGGPLGEGKSSAKIGEIESRITELQGELEKLLRSYTPAHPDTVRTQRALDRAKNELSEAKAAEPPPAAPASPVASGRRATSPNPVYEQIKVRMLSEDGEVASLKARVERQQADVKKWEQSARTVPGVAAELARLMRDHEVLKKNYDELLQRRQSAKIAQDLDTQTDKVQFRIIDPPTVPTKPASPNRVVFLLAVFVGAIGAGGALALLLGQLDQSIATIEQLRALLQLPILGGVSLANSMLDRRQKYVQGLGFAVVCLALVAAFGGVMAIDLLRGFKISLLQGPSA